MFVGFLYELRRRKVPVGTQEAVALSRALEAGLHDSSLDGFYEVARALLVHNEAHLDAFDQAFLAHFKGIEDQGDALVAELLGWLEEAGAKERGERTPEEEAALLALDPEVLRQLLAARPQQEDAASRAAATGRPRRPTEGARDLTPGARAPRVEKARGGGR